MLTPSAGTASMDKLAAFTPRLVVIGHVVFTSIAITALAVLTWRQGRYDTAAVVARLLTVLLAANSTLMILNAFTRGVQKSFDTQLDNATRDPLTGLLNRRGLELWAEQLLRSHPTRVDFILVDLDHFKATPRATTCSSAPAIAWRQSLVITACWRHRRRRVHRAHDKSRQFRNIPGDPCRGTRSKRQNSRHRQRGGRDLEFRRHLRQRSNRSAQRGPAPRRYRTI